MPEPAVKSLTLPLSDADVLNLQIGDLLLLNGVMLTARDAAHRWLVDTFIHPLRQVTSEEQIFGGDIAKILRGGAIYHCGPVVQQDKDGRYRFIAAGPTTSMREEPYQADVIRHFDVRAVIGKGGMGEATLQAFRKTPAVYLQATGGAGALMAACVKEVRGVFRLDFGVPEAMWCIRVEQMPLIVTMDAHGNNLHESIRQKSWKVFQQIFAPSKNHTDR